MYHSRVFNLFQSASIARALLQGCFGGFRLTQGFLLVVCVDASRWDSGMDFWRMMLRTGNLWHHKTSGGAKGAEAGVSDVAL